MLRTQIYLPEELYQEIKWLAKKKEQSTASLIRDFLGESLKRTKKKRNAGTTLKEITALATEGPSDLSTNLFDYLYGEKSDYARKKKKKK